MNILLVAPPQSGTYGRFSAPDIHPLGLGYVAAAAENAGHNVRIVNMDADKVSDGAFVGILKKGDFGLVGITTTTPTFNNSIRLAGMVKEHTPAFTVLGGIHATALPEEAIRSAHVDFVVKGEGEITMVELINHLEGRLEPGSIDGLCYKQEGKVFSNRERELIADLNKIPFPARHLFHNQRYAYPDAISESVFPIITSRGCPSRCTYCAANIIFRQKFRARSPVNIVDEIELLIKKFAAEEIHIWDDNFTLIKPRVILIKEELKKRNLKARFAFPNGIRIDCVDQEMLAALKEMGVYSVAFGVESGSQEILDHVSKGIKLERIVEVFKMVRKFGIEIWGFFIIGLPGENADKIKKTIQFAKKLNPDIAKFHILKPFPGTEAYRELLRENLIIDHNFDNYGIHMPPVHRLAALTREELLEWQKRAYRDFYMRPSVLIRQALRVKSFHRLKGNFITGKQLLNNMFCKPNAPIMTKILFLTAGPDNVASSRVRVYRYFPYFQGEGIKAEVMAFASRAEAGRIANGIKSGCIRKAAGRFFRLYSLLRLLLVVRSFDLLFIQKILLPKWAVFLIAKMLKAGIVFDFDDAIFLGGDRNGSGHGRRLPERFDYIIRNSRCVIAGNHFLMEAAAGLNSNTYVVNTPIDTDRYTPAKKNTSGLSGRVKVGWIGSCGSSRYLKGCKYSFLTLPKEDKNIEFHLIGSDGLYSGLKSVTLKEWDPERELDDLRELDIGIMPLEDDDWAKGKCGYKLLQYMAVGIPCVASPVGMNKLLIKEGVNGFFAVDDKDWAEKIAILAKDGKLRLRMGREGRRIAEELYSYNTIAAQLAGILKEGAKKNA